MKHDTTDGSECRALGPRIDPSGGGNEADPIPVRSADGTWRPFITVMGLVGQKWHLPIVHQLLMADGLGFAELCNELDGISSKVLSESLHDLEEKTLVERTVVNDRPFRVTYSLTPRGESLEPVVRAILDWADDHLTPVDDPDEAVFEV